jgi:hypothetical protein
MNEQKMNKKRVFIAHPIGGDVEGNIRKVYDICKRVHNKDIIPIVPYLVSLQYLNDEIEEDRNLGIDANLETFRCGYVKESWLFGDHISKGMEGEIRLALELGIPIVPQSEGTKNDIVRFIK